MDSIDPSSGTLTIEHARELMALATGDEKHEESSSSTLDTIRVLYDRVLNVDPANPSAKDRDRFLGGHRSIGHVVGVRLVARGMRFCRNGRPPSEGERP